MVQLVTAVWSAEPLAREGIAAMLRPAPDLDVVAIDDTAKVRVVVVVVTALDGRAAELISQVSVRRTADIVLVTDEIKDMDGWLLSTRSMVAILPRASLTAEVLTDTVRRVHLRHTMPPLVDQLESLRSDRVRPRGAPWTGLTEREQEVLRLLAQGLSTIEIAETMVYSERTVKNIIRAILERLDSRSRAHAVAVATREGMI